MYIKKCQVLCNSSTINKQYDDENPLLTGQPQLLFEPMIDKNIVGNIVGNIPVLKNNYMIKNVIFHHGFNLLSQECK